MRVSVWRRLGGGAKLGRMGLPEQIVCVDCGGTCHRLSLPREDGDRPGDTVAYRCSDCLDRWDLVVDEADED